MDKDGVVMQKQQSERKKHVPQRTCIGCRQVAGKRGLIRLVRTPQGIEVDPTGKRAGRGAYIHASRTCWDGVLQGNRISQALRSGLTAENRAALVAFAATLPVDDPADDKVEAEIVTVA